MTNVDDRLAAARALGRVLRKGAWANVATRAECRRGADLRTVMSLTLGALRHIPALDASIQDASGRAIDRIDRGILDLLRIGAHELRSGSERPAGVVVDTIVRAGGELQPRARGFVNAVMRRLAERNGRLQDDAAGRGFEPWLVDRLSVTFGQELEEFLEASQTGAPVGLRSPEPVAGAEPVDGIPGAWSWSHGPPPDGVATQDPASVAVGNAVGAVPGDRVLDVAAAPGGKTAQLSEAVGPTGIVIASDRHPRRVRDARRRVPTARWVVADGRRPPFAAGGFERVLLDAPCTGLGTLRRRPEIRYRVTPEEIERLARAQRAMLEASLELVRPGGRLVYSVCTVTPDETIEVVRGLGGRPPDGTPGRVVGDGCLLAPHLGPTDGMYIVVFDR